jgi:streptogramin lyase
VPPRILSRAVGLGLLLAALLVAPAAAAPFVSGEFTVSSLGSNNKIAQGPDGNVWVTLSDATKDVARITPAGEVTEFDLGVVANAQGIVTGPDGNLWITRDTGVTRFAAGDPENTELATTINDITGSHSIVTGPDGNLWVAASEKLVRIPPAEPNNPQSFSVSGLNPRDIDLAGSQLAIADFGNSRIVLATTGGATTDIPIAGGPQGLAGGPNGQIAFTAPDASPQQVGLVTPPSAPQHTELSGDPFGVALGADGAYWIARTATHNLTRLATDNQMTTLSGFDAQLGPRQIAPGPGNTLWVTMEDFENKAIPEKVARVSGVDPAAVPISGVVPETQITKGPKKKVKTKTKRAKVRFRFKSPNAGATFECALTKLKKQKKGKPAPKPRFKPCRSPQTYRVPVGKYRFQVRAVLAGVADPTPAKRDFRVIRKR